jgi:hypothetical protein
MAQKEGRNFGRINGSSGTAITSSNVALGVGWGDGAVVLAIRTGSNDQAGQFTITSVGSNQAQATATVALTFADGAYSTAPRAVLLSTSNDNALDTGHWKYTCTTTVLTLTHLVLPVATKIYVVDYLVIA